MDNQGRQRCEGKVARECLNKEVTSNQSSTEGVSEPRACMLARQDIGVKTTKTLRSKKKKKIG